MPGTWDANIKLLYAVDQGGFFAADTVNLGDPFDVIANVEIGSSLKGVVLRHDLFVSVRNLSRSTILGRQQFGAQVPPTGQALNEEVRLSFAGGWQAAGDEGDVLEVVASYKVTAGIHTDYSVEKSKLFIVTVPDTP